MIQLSTDLGLSVSYDWTCFKIFDCLLTQKIQLMLYRCLRMKLNYSLILSSAYILIVFHVKGSIPLLYIQS